MRILFKTEKINHSKIAPFGITPMCYFQARNPMLYSVTKSFGAENIVILQINSDILDIPGAGLADGNAASKKTKFFNNITEGLSTLNKEQVERSYWSEADDSKKNHHG